MPTAWTVNQYSWQSAETLAHALGVPLVVGMVLSGRGISDPDQARMFLDCAFPLGDPFLFQGMEGAVRTIWAAIDEKRRIVVHGDYDADGITATALMLLGLRDLGVEAEWYLPNRFDEGYGLSRRAVETIAAKGPGVLITVDCGVNYPEEVALARQSGLDVVVVDHHQPGPRLPECHLIHAVAGDYPHGDLCGVGLALKVMHGLHIARLEARPDALPAALEKLLDLVAIGTIADLASLRGENRYFVREGLKLIEIGQRVGLRALAQISSCTGAIDSGTVAYRLAPRLNAAGRLADPSPPLRLLLTEDEVEAAALAAQLHELNGARQDVERQILDQAVRQVESLGRMPPVLVLAANDWHEGVVGIVASRLVERYHRPSVLLGVRDGVAKGSGRSISGYDLLSGLTACERVLTVYGGHTQAVGVTLGAGLVDEFRCSLEEHAYRSIDPLDLVPGYRADAVLRGDEIDADTASALAGLGPFGSGNPRPRLLLVDAGIHDVEATRKGAHLRCTVKVDGIRVRGIGFGMSEQSAAICADPEHRLVGAQLRVDEWRGTPRPELLLERTGTVEEGAGWPESCGEAGADAPRLSPAAINVGAGISSGQMVPTEIPRAHDLRDRPARLSALAQVLATRESVAVFTCSLPHTLPYLRRHFPVDALSGSEVECVGRASPPATEGGGAHAQVTVVEWDLAAADRGAVGARRHVVVLDPPFRPAHVALMRSAVDQGAVLHLFYGKQEREATARLLRHLVHPRFAMVCMYRAMREGESEGADLFSRAATIGWEEGRVMLTWGDLERARDILAELGVERHGPGEAKLEARSSAAYTAAELEYEECLRLCLTL